MLDKVLGKIKEIIGIIKSDDTKILIEIHDKFPNDITFENVVTINKCLINNSDKFYFEVFLEEELFD